MRNTDENRAHLNRKSKVAKIRKQKLQEKTVTQKIHTVEKTDVILNSRMKAVVTDDLEGQSEEPDVSEIVNVENLTENSILNVNTKANMIQNHNALNLKENSKILVDNSDEEWEKYEQKWKKYLKDSTFYEPPMAKSTDIEPGEVVENENNAGLIKEEMENNKCQICEQAFDNLEDHFIVSHSSMIETKTEEHVHPENEFENHHEGDLENNLSEARHEMFDKNSFKFLLDQSPNPNQGEIVIENAPNKVFRDHKTLEDELIEILDTEDLSDNIENYSSRIQIENPRKVQEVPHPKAKTKVKLLINGDSNNVNWISISKPPNSVTLSDIKLILKSQPKKYSNEKMYVYCVKTTDEDGDIGFEDINEDSTILPLFGDKIILQCWTSE